jgi:hypothetical protein
LGGGIGVVAEFMVNPRWPSSVIDQLQRIHADGEKNPRWKWQESMVETVRENGHPRGMLSGCQVYQCMMVPINQALIRGVGLDAILSIKHSYEE